MTRKSGLGRGLDALITTDEIVEAGGLVEISIGRISPNPRQPRSSHDDDDLEQLADSIREYGVLQPIIVSRDTSRPEHYILIAGERRLLAARKAGIETIPAVLREASDQQRLILALVENVQRSDLNPLEEADAYSQLSEEFGLTHDEIAERVGKSRPEVSNTLRLLKLAPEVKQALLNREISKSHARAISGLSNWPAQVATLETVKRRNLSVRQTEEMVEKLTGEKRVQIPKSEQPSPEIAYIEERLRTHLGAKVLIKQFKQGGAITIRYFSDEELNSLLDALLPPE